MATRLTADVLDDPHLLSHAIIAVVAENDDYKMLSRKVRLQQRRLRRAVDDDAWRTYLRLEEIINERGILVEDLLVRWAFKSGRRS